MDSVSSRSSVECLLPSVPNLVSLFIPGSSLSRLPDLLPLSSLSSLRHLVICDPDFPPPPLASSPNYRLWILYHLPDLDSLDMARIRSSDIDRAESAFRSLALPVEASVAASSAIAHTRKASLYLAANHAVLRTPPAHPNRILLDTTFTSLSHTLDTLCQAYALLLSLPIETGGLLFPQPSQSSSSSSSSSSSPDFGKGWKPIFQCTLTATHTHPLALIGDPQPLISHLRHPSPLLPTSIHSCTSLRSIAATLSSLLPSPPLPITTASVLITPSNNGKKTSTFYLLVHTILNDAHPTHPIPPLLEWDTTHLFTPPVSSSKQKVLPPFPVVYPTPDSLTSLFTTLFPSEPIPEKDEKDKKDEEEYGDDTCLDLSQSSLQGKASSILRSLRSQTPDLQTLVLAPNPAFAPSTTGWRTLEEYRAHVLARLGPALRELDGIPVGENERNAAKALLKSGLPDDHRVYAGNAHFSVWSAFCHAPHTRVGSRDSLSTKNDTLVALIANRNPYLSSFPVHDVHVTLRMVHLASNGLVKLDGLSSLVHLESLSIADNRVTTLAPLGACSRLRHLDASLNQLGRASLAKFASSSLPRLRTLYLTANLLDEDEAAHLASCVSLTSLSLAGNVFVPGIASLTFLSHLTSLKSLVLHSAASSTSASSTSSTSASSSSTPASTSASTSTRSSPIRVRAFLSYKLNRLRFLDGTPFP